MQKRVSKIEKLIREVRRNTHHVFNEEQKIFIVIEGMRGEMTVAELWILPAAITLVSTWELLLFYPTPKGKL